jgi:hypothetical protein
MIGVFFTQTKDDTKLYKVAATNSLAYIGIFTWALDPRPTSGFSRTLSLQF